MPTSSSTCAPTAHAASRRPGLRATLGVGRRDRAAAELDGRTTFDVVAWARAKRAAASYTETPTAETHARDAVLRGIETQTPARVLNLLPNLTDLAYEIRDDAIVVSAP